ncbi:MAG TPA: 23S rRNA (pseudouridine(1915)-N(3))-methyltransferase RlmH, partial [Pyrinomonadaceae bacterium]|nr:23S rRNA (pseudouridine(1915)-N(3))-methyltransferase RlmH [Pyrinomonadaceae bacterium]
MRLHLIWVGKTKNENLRALVDDYLQRLGHFTRCAVTEVREGGARGANEREVLASEERHLLAALKTDATLVLLSE